MGAITNKTIEDMLLLDKEGLARRLVSIQEVQYEAEIAVDPVPHGDQEEDTGENASAYGFSPFPARAGDRKMDGITNEHGPFLGSNHSHYIGGHTEIIHKQLLEDTAQSLRDYAQSIKRLEFLLNLLNKLLEWKQYTVWRVRKPCPASG